MLYLELESLEARTAGTQAVHKDTTVTSVLSPGITGADMVSTEMLAQTSEDSDDVGFPVPDVDEYDAAFRMFASHISAKALQRYENLATRYLIRPTAAASVDDTARVVTVAANADMATSVPVNDTAHVATANADAVSMVSVENVTSVATLATKVGTMSTASVDGPARLASLVLNIDAVTSATTDGNPLNPVRTSTDSTGPTMCVDDSSLSSRHVINVEEVQVHVPTSAYMGETDQVEGYHDADVIPADLGKGQSEIGRPSMHEGRPSTHTRAVSDVPRSKRPTRLSSSPSTSRPSVILPSRPSVALPPRAGVAGTQLDAATAFGNVYHLHDATYV